MNDDSLIYCNVSDKVFKLGVLAVVLAREDNGKYTLSFTVAPKIISSIVEITETHVHKFSFRNIEGSTYRLTNINAGHYERIDIHMEILSDGLKHFLHLKNNCLFFVWGEI